MTEETKNRDDTINRPDGSTYLEEKSVLRNGATPVKPGKVTWDLTCQDTEPSTTGTALDRAVLGTIERQTYRIPSADGYLSSSESSLIE